MSLPPKAPKSYLTVADEPRGFVIRARKEHADALAALYVQHGISCHREADVRPGEDALEFFDGVPRTEVARLLEEFKTAKGS